MGTLIQSSSEANLPIVRYVYLVQDATDAIRMGGTSSNVYTTAQAAYNAANTLQIALGGTNIVGVIVGHTTAAVVGGITLTSDWNTRVYFIGNGVTISEIGNITADNAVGNSYRVGSSVVASSARFYSIKIGNVSSSPTGATGNSLGVGLYLVNSECGNINTNVTNAANLTGTGGTVTLGAATLPADFAVSTITTSAQGAVNAGSVTINSRSNVRVTNITTCNNNTGGSITINCGLATITSISMIGTVSTGTFQLTNCTVTLVTYTGSSKVDFVRSTIGSATVTSLGGIFEHNIDNSNIGPLTSNVNIFTTAKNSRLTTIVNLGNNSIIENSIINSESSAASPAINGIGSTVTFRNSTVRPATGQLAIDNTNNPADVHLYDSQLYNNVDPALTVYTYNGFTLLADVVGTFTFNAIPYRACEVVLAGSNAGVNTLDIINPIVGQTYTAYVNNSTGTDTLTIIMNSGLGTVITQGGTPYTPTASVGGLDLVSITCVNNSLLLITPFYNYL